MTISQKKTYLLTIGLLICLGLSFITASSEFSTYAINQPLELNTDSVISSDFNDDAETETPQIDSSQSGEKQKTETTWYEGKTTYVNYTFGKHQITNDEWYSGDDDDDPIREYSMYTDWFRYLTVEDNDNDDKGAIYYYADLHGFTSGHLYYYFNWSANDDGSDPTYSTKRVGLISNIYRDAGGVIRIKLESRISGNTFSRSFYYWNGESWTLSYSYTQTDSDGFGYLDLKVKYLYYQQESITSNIRSKYRYINEETKEHSLSIENPEYSTNITVKPPPTWNLVSINPIATYEKTSDNDYIFYGNTIPVSYELRFLEKINNTLAIEDVSYCYLNDLNLETGADWIENTTETFDSLTLSNEIFAYESTSLKLIDTDNSTDTLNITSALPVGTAFASFEYYIANLVGNFSFLYYNGSWQQFNLDNTTNRWLLFQDFINITDDTLSNIVFQLQGYGTIYLDGFRVYNTTLEASTYSYDYTKISGYLRNWDSAQDPLLTYENITVYLKNSTSTLESWITETDGLAYFSVLSTYSFTNNQYHIEVETATTSLTQNSSTTYLIPDYDFPTNYAETVLHTKMDEGGGTTVSDSSGNGNHGANQGASWTTIAINGSALDFESSESDYVNFSDSNDFSFTDGSSDLAFTWEAWIRIESDGASQCILSKWDHSTDSREYRWWISADRNLYIRLFTNDSDIGWIHAYTTDQPISLNSWTYVVATYDGSEQASGLKLYINGTLSTTLTTGENGDYQGMSNGLDVLEFGRTLALWHFDGIMDDIRIHKNLELSASQIATRFQNYTNYDYTQGEYYTYSSSSISKSIAQKSYFTPLNITETVSTISLYETSEYFLIFSFNFSLTFRTWSSEIYTGDYYVGQIISKNRTGGVHTVTYQAWTAGESYVYLPTAKYNYSYEFNEQITVFLGLSNQFGVGLPWETVKVYANGTRLVFPFLNVLNNSKIFIEVYDYFDILLFNQTFTANRDNMEINIALTIFEVIFINEGDYPSEVLVYKNDTLGYNFTVYPGEVRTAMMIEGLYKYKIYYHEKYWIQDGEAGVNEDIDTDPTLHTFKSFRVTASLPTVVDASSPKLPSLIPDFIQQLAPWLVMLTLGLLATAVTSALGLLWQYLVHRRTWAQRIDKGEIVWDPRRWELYKQQLKR